MEEKDKRRKLQAIEQQWNHLDAMQSVQIVDRVDSLVFHEIEPVNFE